MTRTRERSQRGEWLRASVPHSDWKTATFMAGLRTTGIVAPYALDEPINADAFEVTVDNIVVASLGLSEVVIIGNLFSHNQPKATELIEAAGPRVLFLPHYSSDLNLIEKALKKLKALLRNAV